MSGPLIAAAIPLETLVALLIAITLAWLVMSVVVLRRGRRDREIAVLQARPRRRERSLATEESGTFVPFAPVFESEPEPEPEPEPDPEPESLEPESLDPLPNPATLGAASAYEIVWYRDEERIAFALQPLDGRAAPWARYRSSSFAWTEDRDPPASLRPAQRAHGRLRARLERDAWVPTGRGESWYRHRFAPPLRAPAPHGDDET